MKLKWRLSFLFIISILALLTFWNYQNRVYDWDMPGYMGCMYTSEFPDSPDKVRIITYEDIKKEAPAEHYTDIIGIKQWDIPRQYFVKNTQSFTEQLPYFQIKVGYILVITLFYKLGFTAPMAVLFTSLISYFFSGILLFYILKLLFPKKYWLAIIVTVVAMLLPPMTYMSRVSTPDMFIFQFMLIFMIGLIKKWNNWAMFVLLFAITFIRPDYITFTLTYIIAVFFFHYFREKKIDVSFIAQGIVLLAMYLAIIKFYHYPGWKDLFYDTFIDRRPIISTHPIDVSLKDYLSIIYIKIIYFKKVTLSLAIMIGVIFWRSKDAWVRMIAVLFVVNVYIKFFFFPQSAALRFFFPFIFPVFIVMLYVLSRKYNDLKLGKIA
ncbi:hypothetical protein J2795_003767 [Chryseobacterium bernardetii]|uniref:Dolichyl-phosphate-mannose-protein mannosyltransferase n=2 Tax=Chryseobacterium TaxID=59732 RepID=A0A543E4K7_9FLAO|nr:MULTISPECIES: hypothetical protein [Chryseobacterium]MDR6372818.1 hypothetical protein [Chryseobacterium vietnamense]MDR6443036.1 hypothetical protein [Chryseobacterium bernardetii]TQM16528.1 hypothetical protein FB551_4411 [Chryseobacterium aquifrigidense]